MEQRKVIDDTTERLTGSKAYQEQLKAASAELDGGMGIRNSPGSGLNGWDFDSDDEDAVAMAWIGPTKQIGLGWKPSEGGFRDKGRQKKAPPTTGDEDMSNLVVKVRDALTNMATSMATFLQDQGS